MSPRVIKGKIRHIKMMWFVMGVCFLIFVLSCGIQPFISVGWLVFAYIAYRSAKNTSTEIVESQ